MEILKNFYNEVSGFDLIYIFFTVLSLIKCSRKGFVLSLLAAFKWLLAYVLTIYIFPKVNPYVEDILDNEYVLDLILGIGIFVIVIFLILMINKAISKAVSYSGITYMKLLVDGTEVTQGREVISYDYQGSAHSVERIINEYTFITDASSEDVANGKFTSWSSAKTIKFQAMRHGSSYTATFHKIRYWVDGSGNPGVNSDAKPPMLTIQSFA